MDPDESFNHYWKRLKTERPPKSNHFENTEATDDHFVRHGYNITTFEYPITCCKKNPLIIYFVC